jgi:REP element-mobilizing transposase RayT
VLTGEHLATLREVFASVCADFGADLVELDGQDDHVHLLVAYPPQVAIARLVNSLKGVSARRLRQRYRVRTPASTCGRLLPDPAAGDGRRHRHPRRDRSRPGQLHHRAQAERDQPILAAGVIAATTIDLVGTIGRSVLANLLPDARLWVSPRIVKRALSKYNALGPNITRISYKATVSIDILTPPARLTARDGP